MEGALELHASRPGLRIERRYAGALPEIQADPDQISRALKNVVANAVEAMRGAGRLEAIVGAESGSVIFEIADNGPGLTDEAARRLFEPYFTTKEKGTGLGLAITYRVVAEHGGLLTAENREEGGTRVVIRLPSSRAREATGPTGGQEERATG
jgi:signal transduction histidine kinase